MGDCAVGVAVGVVGDCVVGGVASEAVSRCAALRRSIETVSCRPFKSSVKYLSERLVTLYGAAAEACVLHPGGQICVKLR